MTSPIPADVAGVDTYDAGLLSDHGGGDVGWWQDYIRAELGRAHDFYATLLTTLASGREDGLINAAEFLLDRLDEAERDLADDDFGREFSGHVIPAMARLRMALPTPPTGEA